MYIADPRLVPHDIFAYTLHPTRLAMLTEGATPEERTLAGQHWAYSEDLLSRGVIIFAGRTVSPTADSFALVVIKAPSLEAARTIAANDPAVRLGVFRMAVLSVSTDADGGLATGGRRHHGTRCLTNVAEDKHFSDAAATAETGQV